MDEELERRFDALMRRVNDNHEAVLIELRNLRTTVDTTQEFVTRSPALIVQALQTPLLDRLTAIEARLRKIEEP
jgi:PHD/YefM family antitoxin component YafN of YafNO toxin-antitoxin module